MYFKFEYKILTMQAHGMKEEHFLEQFSIAQVLF
jgi:hypothetical protein